MATVVQKIPGILPSEGSVASAFVDWERHVPGRLRPKIVSSGQYASRFSKGVIVM